MGVNYSYRGGKPLELGEKLRSARLEAGLSQRQLCGEELTRNMLSQIENGAARPSLDTLCLLARRLGRPVSWFLEETAVVSSNLEVMAAARQLYDAQAYARVLQTLQDYREPDAVFDREYRMLLVLSLLALAQQAFAEEKLPYARELLEKAEAAEAAIPYCRDVLQRQRQTLQAQLPGQKTAAFPSLDGELLLRAEAALGEENVYRANTLLDAVEDKTTQHFFLLWGKLRFFAEEYPAAAEALERAEAAYPRECVKLLEVCYREMGDYKRAYEYARKLN